jgi:hypothetical protein
MNDREQDALVEAAVTAYRRRDPEGRLVPPAEWWDLAPEALEELYRRLLLTRELERLIDPQGWSGTVRAVMERIGG